MYLHTYLLSSLLLALSSGKIIPDGISQPTTHLVGGDNQVTRSDEISQTMQRWTPVLPPYCYLPAISRVAEGGSLLHLVWLNSSTYYGATYYASTYYASTTYLLCLHVLCLH